MFSIGIFGGGAKIVPVCDAPAVHCPCCEQYASFSVHRSYNYLHAYWIPLLRFHVHYLAICPHCAAAFALDQETGRRMERSEHPPFSAVRLHLIQNGAKRCPICKEPVLPQNKHCTRCDACL